MNSTHIFKKDKTWFLSIEDSIIFSSDSLYDIAVRVEESEGLPLPEVREYDSMEEAIAEES